MTPANTQAILCGSCNTILPWVCFNREDTTPCPTCGAQIYGVVFPALFREQEKPSSGETILVDGEAGCFYHPQKKAVTPCSHCGRFLCALCDVDLNGRHFCPRCIEEGKQKGRLKNLENRRTLYDEMAMSLSVLPLFIFWFLTCITAPIALFLAIRHWNSPSSIIPRTKIRFVIAIVFAGVQVIGWLALLVYLVYYLVTR